jgi:large subunit ribosomal protein L32
MAVPKQRQTKSRRNRRRANLFLKRPSLVKCPKCGKMKRPNTVCQNCGYYKGKQIIDVLKDLNKKERKKKEKEIDSKEEQKPKNISMEELSKK